MGTGEYHAQIQEVLHGLTKTEVAFWRKFCLRRKLSLSHLPVQSLPEFLLEWRVFRYNAS